MKKPREVIQPRWGVYRLGGKKAKRMLFTVTARTSEEAIERAIKEYDVPERERFRISVQREAQASFGQLTNGCAGDAASAFATCGHTVALALGSKWAKLRHSVPLSIRVVVGA